jgi:4-hydroxybenzoate polyprenyltransferase/phosphoserine phosphatase
MPISTKDDAISVHDKTPLIVDLDGTLISSDLFFESAFLHLGLNPARIAALVPPLTRGKAALKEYIAARTEIDVSNLPYDQQVLDLVREARLTGRRVYLASASNERYVAAVAAHLALFDGWFASSERQNLSSVAKARRLIDAFGERGFDYIGNEAADLPVWRSARRRIGVRMSPGVRTRLLAIDPDASVVVSATQRGVGWIRMLRVHQWAKNALVFVPLLTAHHFDLPSIGAAILAFFAFSFAASGMYIVNDLVDLGADRKHPTKKLRPLAAGTLPIPQAIIVAAALVVVALCGAFFVTPLFAAVLFGYVVLTTVYTLFLKRKMIVDVIALAFLYTIRVVGGAVATSVSISEWLLGFSIFIFTTLALVKRYIELAVRLDTDLPDPSNRNYQKTDLAIIAALAAAAGFNAVTIFALYISSEAVHRLYSHPEVLWFICPVLMYWLGRILMMAHRRLIDDDPIVFALKDRNSLVTLGLLGAILVGAF